MAVCCFYQGDVKAYLRSSKCTDGVGAPEPLILQRMACDIASGLKHLHVHNFTHGYHKHPTSHPSSHLATHHVVILVLRMAASCNNILVLTECCSKTPASVILLQAVDPRASSSSNSALCRSTQECHHIDISRVGQNS